MRVPGASAMVVMLAALVGASPAWARFDLRDADQIDPEVDYNTETYNDKLSYRPPLAWDELWAAHAIGFRINAGSLNATRFDYHEDVKFHVNPDWKDGPVGVGFTQSRREDVLERREDRTVRINWLVFDTVSLSLLGDGGIEKEYGDLGGAIGWWLSPQVHGEVFFWSVDHFYSTKKEFAEDKQAIPPRSAGTRGRWQAGDSNVTWTYEHDLPMDWHRESSGYDYAASRRTGTLRWELGALTSYRWHVQADAETKDEKKVVLAGGATDWLKRRSGIYELGLARRTATGHDQTAGLLHIERFADFTEGTSTRSELAWYVTDYWLLDGRHFAQVGLHTNHVIIKEGGERRETESKGQTAWEYRITERARILLNTTWDIDQIGRDYPYGKKRPFRPWGGGDIQFIAVF